MAYVDDEPPSSSGSLHCYECGEASCMMQGIKLFSSFPGDAKGQGGLVCVTCGGHQRTWDTNDVTNAPVYHCTRACRPTPVVGTQIALVTLRLLRLYCGLVLSGSFLCFCQHKNAGLRNRPGG